MTTDIRLIKEMREEVRREIGANRLSKSLRKSQSRRRERESSAAAFAREVRLDFVRLAGVLRVSGKGAKRKGRT